MIKKSLRILEYNKIIDLLTEKAGSEGARRMAQELEPKSDPLFIAEEQKATTEARTLIERKGPLPAGGIHDIARSVSFAHKGGTLTMKQLLEIKYDLEAAEGVVSFMRGDLPELPYLSGLVDLLVSLPHLSDEIGRCILTEDEMADSASPKLKDLRRNIRQQEESIRSRLNRIITSTENKTYLQDALVTIRDGRLVVPVKQEYRSRFPGLVHDQSKGGQTLFIEPQAIVEMNNRLRELEVEEEAEIARILAELSSRVGEHAKEINSNQKLLTRLDFIMAKGKLSRDMQAEEPLVTDGKVFRLVKARHPLLDPEKAVPIDIEMGDPNRALIITGPNTGGKTVSLKTAGLLSLMAMSGLHIPVLSAEIPLFDEVFADIGDEQSIEQSLSTFSSHMKNIVEITGNAGPYDLVLLDELGAGTDPTEGAALAISILEDLKKKGAMIMATTHYNELKKYALQTPGVENASMEFDIDTLSPTYHLITGTPGRSNAFEISKKLGLSQEMIDRASRLIERGDLEFENVISSIENDMKKAREERDAAALIAEDMRKRSEKLAEKEADLAAKREKILSEARREARDLVREAKDAEKEMRKELRELSKRGLGPEAEKRLESSRRRLRQVEQKNQERTVRQINSNPVDIRTLAVGDRVKVLSINQNGEVIGLPDNRGEMQVAIGGMRLTVNVKDLMLINEGPDRKTGPKATVRTSLGSGKARSISPQINVQGENLEDALMDVEKYLDDVYIAGLERVTVIHGRGEGVLKNGIRKMLRENRFVKSFEAGKYNEGGEGVTIVTMKR